MIAQAHADEFTSEHIENAAFFKRVDVGDGNHEEQKEFAIFQYRVLCRGIERIVMPRTGVGDTDEHPDDPAGQQHRLGFAHVDDFFEDHQHVGENENDECNEAERMIGEL